MRTCQEVVLTRLAAARWVYVARVSATVPASSEGYMDVVGKECIPKTTKLVPTGRDECSPFFAETRKPWYIAYKISANSM